MKDVIELDEATIVNLKKSIEAHTKILTFQYFITPLAVITLAVAIFLFNGMIPTKQQQGGLMVFMGVCLALYAAPNLEAGNEIRRLLIWSGNRSCPELTRRFGYNNVKATFYAAEAVFLGFGTLKGVYGF